jgi:hypothetical protein
MSRSALSTTPATYAHPRCRLAGSRSARLGAGIAATTLSILGGGATSAVALHHTSPTIRRERVAESHAAALAQTWAAALYGNVTVGRYRRTLATHNPLSRQLRSALIAQSMAAELLNLAPSTNAHVHVVDEAVVAHRRLAVSVRIETRTLVTDRSGRSQFHTDNWIVNVPLSTLRPTSISAWPAAGFRKRESAPRAISNGTIQAANNIPYVPGPAWTMAGDPGIYLAEPYWSPLATSGLPLAPVDSSGVACTHVSSLLDSFQSDYFSLLPDPAGGMTFCAEEASLKADNRWNETVASLATSASSPTVALVLPRPPDTGATNVTSLVARTSQYDYHAHDWVRRGQSYFPTTLAVGAQLSATRGALVSNSLPYYGSGTYNRSAALSHAHTWWDGHDPAYNSYEPDDCTNFISQNFTAGGFAPEVWSEAWRMYTSEWVNVTSFRAWMWQNSLIKGIHPGSAQIGDVVFYDWDSDAASDGVWDHSSMISTPNGGYNYITQHSPGHYNYAVATQIQIEASQNPPQYTTVGYYGVERTN